MNALSGLWKRGIESKRVRIILLALGLVLLTVAVLGEALRCDFIDYDDHIYVLKNPNLQYGFTPESLKWAFTGDLLYDSYHIDYWQPMTLLSRLMDVTFYRFNPAGHHFTNLLIHAFNVLLVFFLLQGLTGCVWRSFLVAVLFAVHPEQVETVAWVTARKDLLSTFFGLLTMVAYGRYGKHPSAAGYVGVFFLFLLALMSKTMMITLPCVLLLLDYWPLQRISLKPFKAKQWLRALSEKAPFLLVSVISASWHLFRRPDALGYTAPAKVFLNYGTAYMKYLGRTFYPANLGFYGSDPIPLSPVVMAFVAVFMIGVTFAMFRWPDRRYLAVGWLWFLGVLVPIAGLQQHADRFVYLGIIGLSVIVVWGLADLCHGHRMRKILFMGFAVAVGLTLVFLSWRQVKYWHNTKSFFSHALELNPRNPEALQGVGGVLYEEGKVEESIRYFQEALRISPDYTDALFFLGMVLNRQGRYDEAIGYYRRLTEVAPSMPEPYFNLGVIFYNRGQPEIADVFFQKTVNLYPDYVKAHYRLGLIRSDQKRYDEAIGHLKAVVRLVPDFTEARGRLSRLYFQKKDYESALRHLKYITKQSPDSPLAHQELGKVFMVMGQLPEARGHFLKALELDPDNANLQCDVASFFVQTKALDKAFFHFSRALEIEPNHPRAIQGLLALRPYFDQNKPKE